MFNQKNRKIRMNMIKKNIRYTTAAILVKLTNGIVKELNGGRPLTMNGK